jgi:zona occludens toxin
MLILLEGPPRAGKSYSAVREHILPALKRGRRVYARLNGLDHAKIAEYLKLPQSRVEELLVLLAHKDVVATLTCFGDDPPKFQIENDALVVVDECHDFWVSGRQALPKEQEAFFAKHGHIGLDVVLMTQAVGRLHSAIRQRIERKQVYAKMNALGKSDAYVVRFYAVGDTMGKFEKVGSERHDYDPEIYPLYHGFQPGTENTEAYTEGSKTVWQVIKGPAIVMALALVAGIGAIVYFFTGGKDNLAENAVIPKQEASIPAVKTAGASQTGSSPIVQRPVAPPKAKLSPGVSYVVELMRTARPRLLGTYESNGRTRVIVEFRAMQGQAMDRLTGEQLEDLGFQVTLTRYGAMAKGEGETIIFTQWPIDPIFAQSTATTARIQSASSAPPAPQAQPVQTNAVSATETAAPAGVIGYEPGKRADVFPRSPGYTAETWTGPVTGL